MNWIKTFIITAITIIGVFFWIGFIGMADVAIYEIPIPTMMVIIIASLHIAFILVDDKNKRRI